MTTFLDNYTYNLTKIISTDIIEQPTTWVTNFNAEMGGTVIVAGLAVLAIALFLIARNQEGIKDSEAAVYAGFITSIVATLIFLIAPVSGVKLLTFQQLLVFLVGTGIAILINTINRRF